MGAEVEQLLVKISADISDLKKKAEESKSVFDDIGRAAKKLGATFGIAFGAREIIGFFKDSIAAASESEQATVRLTNALRAQGVTSTKVRDGILEYSGALQKQTAYDDEAITGAQTLLFQLGRLSGEGLKTATQSTLDLAAGLGIDLHTAALLVGKAAAGNVSAFSRYGLVVKSTGDKVKDFAELQRQISSRFGGSAAAEVDTYSGSMSQFKNQVGEVKEALGTGLLPILGNAAKAWTTFASSLASAIRTAETEMADFVNAAAGDVKTDSLKDVRENVEQLKLALDSQTMSFVKLSSEGKAAVAHLLNMTVAEYDAAQGTEWLADKLTKTMAVYKETGKTIDEARKKQEDLASKQRKEIDPAAEAAAAAKSAKVHDEIIARLQREVDARNKLLEAEQKEQAAKDRATNRNTFANLTHEIDANAEALRLAEKALSDYEDELDAAADANKGPASDEQIAKLRELNSAVLRLKQSQLDATKASEQQAKATAAAEAARQQEIAATTQVVDGLANAFLSVAEGTATAEEAAKSLFLNLVQQAVSYAAQQAAILLVGKTATEATAATTIAGNAGVVASNEAVGASAVSSSAATTAANTAAAASTAARLAATEAANVALATSLAGVAAAAAASAAAVAAAIPTAGIGSAPAATAAGAATMAAMSPFIVTAALHEGGEIGGPPGRDPTIIAVERGERVLSREQNAEYKAGGAGRGMSLTFNFNSVLPPDRTQMKIIVRDEFLPVMRELERSGY